MNDHHDCGSDLTMAPWSIGKYAKRTATLHIGSEDLTTVNASTGRLFPISNAPALINVFDCVDHNDDAAPGYGGVTAVTGATSNAIRFFLGIGRDSSVYEGTVGNAAWVAGNGHFTDARQAQIDATDNFLVVTRPAIRFDTDGAGNQIQVPLLAINDTLKMRPIINDDANIAARRIHLYGYQGVAGISNDFAGTQTVAEAKDSMTGTHSEMGVYWIVRPVGSAINSLSGLSVIELQSEQVGFVNVLKANFAILPVNTVDIEVGDIVRIRAEGGAIGDGNETDTERVIVGVNVATMELTLDHPIAANEVNALVYDQAQNPTEGSRVSVRRNAQFQVMYKGFDSKN